MPETIRHRHTWLSTMCMSSALDDIMRRGLDFQNKHASQESYERQRARIEVAGLIAQAMHDPRIRNADCTIIAVLQLLTSEVMGCNDEHIEMHQGGLHSMIRERGGLQQLGVNGCLATMVTT